MGMENPGHLTGKSGKVNWNLPKTGLHSVVHGVKYSVHDVKYSVHGVEYSVHGVNYRLRLTADNFPVRCYGLFCSLLQTSSFSITAFRPGLLFQAFSMTLPAEP